MSFSPSTSSSTSFASFPKMVEELESKWSQSVPEGLKILDKICHDVEDDGQRQEATKFVANKIRTASVYRKYKIFEELCETSVMCRIYLSHEFLSVHDCIFPRLDIFYGKSRLPPTRVFFQPAHRTTMVFGNNAHFNLGIENDAKPIEEMIMLDVPLCRKIAMSNSHTLFVTHDGKVGGCGKASLLRIDADESTDEYLKKPTELGIPDEEFVLDILAENDGSLIVTNKFMYVMGSVNIDAIEQVEVTRLSANCKRIVLTRKEGQFAKIRGKGKIALEFFEPKNAEHNTQSTTYEKFIVRPVVDYYVKNMGPWFSPNEVELKISNSKVKVRIHCYSNHLLFTFPSVPDTYKRCRLVLNGRLVENKFVKEYYTSPDGRIVMKLTNGILVKGRLEIQRYDKDELSCPRWGQFENGILTTILAIVDEIPGSYGVETFCCSPDLENCIFQIGENGQNQMVSFNKELFFNYQKIEEEEFEKIEEADIELMETIDSLCETLERIITVLNENRQLMVLRKNPFAHSLISLLKSMKLAFEGNPVRGFHPLMIFTRDFFLNYTTTEEEKTYCLCNEDIITKIQSSIVDIRGPRVVPLAHVNFKIFGMTARIVERLLAEEVASAIEQNFAEKYDCRRLHRFSLKTMDISKIVSNRVESGELEPNDVPIDLMITVSTAPGETEYLAAKTNKTIFELMYPNWAEKIGNGCFNVTGFAYNYFFNRFDCLAFEMDFDWKSYFPGVATQIVKLTEEGNVLFRLMPKTPISDFAGTKTSREDIWFFEAMDGKRIPVHKYLILLHSRRLQASRRFNFFQTMNYLALMQGSSKSKTQEPTVIKTTVTSDVIENAVRALLDMTSLYDKSVDDVTAVLVFYDYHLMDEAFDDGVQIICQMINDSNLDILYWLFEKFEQRITPHLLKHNRLILMSVSEHIPPRGFIKRFSELVSDSMGSESGEYRWPKLTSPEKSDAEDVMRHMIDFEADLDESLLKVFADDWQLDFETVRTNKMFNLENLKKPREGERELEGNKKPRLG